VVCLSVCLSVTTVSLAKVAEPIVHVPAVRHLGFLMRVFGPPKLVNTLLLGHLVVFISVQNLVGIDEAVSIICRFLIWRVWLDNA